MFFFLVNITRRPFTCH